MRTPFWFFFPMLLVNVLLIFLAMGASAYIAVGFDIEREAQMLFVVSCTTATVFGLTQLNKFLTTKLKEQKQ